jgi:DHA1 family tetracycline resistance protein-like MFS transporter
MAGPALAGMLSVRIAADAQGMLQGVMASLNGVAVVLTPLVMPWIFGIVAGAPFVLSAALAVLGVLCIQRGSSADRRDHLVQPA